MEIIILGFFTFVNILSIIVKVKERNILDAILDASTMTGLATMFGHSATGASIASVASAMFSIYLYFNPTRMSRY